jgi:hypothetical protein
VTVQLGRADAIDEARSILDDLGANDIAVERVGSLLIRDVDDAVIEGDACHHGRPFVVRSGPAEPEKAATTSS